MGHRVNVLISFVSLAFAGAAAPSLATECLDALRPALLAGGFTGSVDCQKDQLSVRHVGQVQKFGRTFQIYAYRYRLKPVCPECAVRGGQRIIFMERGHYVGQYKLDFVQAAVQHGELLLIPTGPEKPLKVQFTRDGPPNTLWVDGEVVSFFR